MKNKKLTIGGAGLIALLVTAGLAASSFAYQGDPGSKGSSYSPQRHEAMMQTLEAGDYNAWEELMSEKSRVKELINEDNFSEFVRAQELAKSGDILEATEIRDSLGLVTKGQGIRGGKDCQGACQGNKTHKRGMRNQGSGGGFVDSNGDGVCDNLQ